MAHATAPSPPAPLPRRHWCLHFLDCAANSIFSLPPLWGRVGVGGERRLTFPPPSRPSPIKGEGVRFSESARIPRLVQIPVRGANCRSGPLTPNPSPRRGEG